MSDSFATPWTVACQAPCLWNFPGKNTRADCRLLFQGIFPTQGSNSCLMQFVHWQADSLPLGPPGKLLPSCNVWFFCAGQAGWHGGGGCPRNIHLANGCPQFSAPKLRFFTTSWAAASVFTRRVPSGSRQKVLSSEG